MPRNSAFNTPIASRVFPCLFCNKCKKDSPIIIITLDGNINNIELIFCPTCLDVLSSKVHGQIEWLSRVELKKRTGHWIICDPNRYNTKCDIGLYVI